MPVMTSTAIVKGKKYLNKRSFGSSLSPQNNLVGFAVHIHGDDSVQIGIGKIIMEIEVDKSIELSNSD